MFLSDTQITTIASQQIPFKLIITDPPDDQQSLFTPQSAFPLVKATALHERQPEIITELNNKVCFFFNFFNLFVKINVDKE